MTLTKDDRISGNLYVLASSAEEAQEQVVAHLHGPGEDHVFDELKEAMTALLNRYNPPPDLRVYVVYMDIKPVDSWSSK